MRIFIAGATGTLGRPTVRMLQERGHDVIGLTRSAHRRHLLEDVGARAVVGDALDPQRLTSLVTDARPDVVVHLLTALPVSGALRARDLRQTNRLRVAGTAHLIAAAIAAGAERLVAESFVGVYGAARFPHRADEVAAATAPLPDGHLREAAIALRSLEQQVLRARSARHMDATALRFGLLYGPGVPLTDDLVAQARRGHVIVPGVGGTSAFVHVDDAVAAIGRAVERGAPSPAYNIVDDEPMGLATALERFAYAAGARTRRVPAWLARLAAPAIVDLAAAELRVSNARARRELGWAPRFASIEAGFDQLLRGSSVSPVSSVA
jgi:nucleoside-diphosphate-sugar epimerase